LRNQFLQASLLNKKEQRMKGDFTRDSFDPVKGFTRVMMQQGRPQLDADWNEQVSIFWESWRSFISDVVGHHAGPERDCGFAILTEGDFPFPAEVGMSPQEQERLQQKLQGSGDFLIGGGHYYVDGIRCTNTEHITYRSQAAAATAELEKSHRPYLVYLDVWERHISDAEDNIREVALLGTTTCSRAKIEWQVRTFELRGGDKDKDKEDLKKVDCSWVREQWEEIVHHWQGKHRGRLRARTNMASDNPSLEPSVVSPASSYRGPSNQLYRVEIHRGGAIAQGDTPTFKFSRENGSVIFPVQNVAGAVVTVANLGRNLTPSLSAGDYVELVDDDYVLQNRAEPLLLVEKVDAGKMQVTLRNAPASTVGQNPNKHPLLRRWDHKPGDPKKGGLELQEGAAVVKEDESDKFWLTLENGVQVQFRKSEELAHYRTGDYWLIPARVATGDVVWPVRGGKPEAIGPQGVEHHYAPLAIVSFKKDCLETLSDCRLKFQVQTHY
jgi:hypothetical protein